MTDTTSESPSPTESALPRETGAEKSDRRCPECGGPMQVRTSAYGSVTAYCPVDHAPAPPATEKAAEKPVPRQTGTDTPKETPA